MKIFVDRVLEKKIENLNPSYNLNYCELDYVYADNGKITALKNFDLLKEKKIIVDYYFYKSIGSVIDNKKISSDRVAGILITSDNKENLILKRKQAFNKIKILSENNNNIMYDYFN